MGSESLAGGRYRLDRPLGRGGMATVYLGHDIELGRPVAVKFLAENLAGDEAFRARFVREGRLAGRLSHPNVVTVYDAGDEGRPYIVMEYVEGETLADLVARRGRLPPDEARALALQACRGLAHAHQEGLVHRDVKPQNLILRADGTLKVADFGIARAAEATALTQSGTILGTAAYLAPEQALGAEVTAAADVYSLGAVLYEVLTGRPPFEFESLAALADSERTITPVRELAPDVPQELENVVMRCLARNPDYRPASAAQLAHELEPSTRPLVEAPPRRGAENKRIWLAIGGALAVAAALLAVLLVGRGSSSDSGAGGNPSTTAVTVGGAAPKPIARGSSAQDQARNIAAWLRKYSRAP
jgi:eukaryotic-like serine/threonine-protein kinase